MPSNAKDFASGIVFIAAGLFYGAIAWKSLPIGSALNMGPGYFPIMLTAIIIALGFAMTIRGVTTRPDSRFGVMPWSGMVFITLSVLFFAVAFEQLGIFPTIFGCVLIASYAGRQITVVEAIVASLVVAAFCSLVFGLGLRLPVPVLGPLFGQLSF